jgi:hypothetical protein
MTMRKSLIIYLFCLFPLNALAAIVFEFNASCTDLLRNTDCAYFGLNGGDPVTGGFQVDDAFGASGAISLLENDQYQLIFNFGNQSFTEADATSLFGFNVSADGAGFSSIVGNFTNANGAELTLLTLTTANIALDGSEADTFGGGGGWALAEGSDLFTVPLPASAWLFVSAISLLGSLARRMRKRD